MEIYETIEYRDHKINIYEDDDSINPREDYDNFGTMICFHSRYNLGDEHDFDGKDDFEWNLALDNDYVEQRVDHWESGNGWSYLENKYEYKSALNISDEKVCDIINDELRKEYIILPLYLYDHSGITMNTTGFSCNWDSGQVGYIYVSVKDAKENFGWKNMSEKRRMYVKNILKNEVEIYDDYLCGNVYGYVIDDFDSDIGSCWGFFGDDFEKNGLKSQAVGDINSFLE